MPGGYKLVGSFMEVIDWQGYIWSIETGMVILGGYRLVGSYLEDTGWLHHTWRIRDGRIIPGGSYMKDHTYRIIPEG